jgi:hypothetical protein
VSDLVEGRVARQTGGFWRKLAFHSLPPKRRVQYDASTASRILTCINGMLRAFGARLVCLRLCE